MKKLSYFLFTALAALAMIFSLLGTVTAFATTEQTYDIVLTKVKMTSLAGWPKQNGADGTEYTGQQLNIQNYFGAGSETLEGVWFEVHK